MWLNVRFLNAAGAVVSERGGYDMATAELDTTSTAVYEMHVGLSADAAAATGLTAGPTARMALADTIVKDSRIPPRGFNNAAFQGKGAPTVGATYADGQYWDDRSFEIPGGTTRAEVRLYYQNTPKEYIEHLRDANTTNAWGTVLYNLWQSTGRGAPIEMTSQTLNVATAHHADFNRNGTVEIADLFAFLNAWFSQSPGADFDTSGGLAVADIFAFLNDWFTGP